MSEHLIDCLYCLAFVRVKDLPYWIRFFHWIDFNIFHCKQLTFCNWVDKLVHRSHK